MAKCTKPNRMTLGSAEHSGDLTQLPSSVTLFSVSPKYETVLSSLDPVSLRLPKLGVIAVPIGDRLKRSFSVPHSTTCTM